MRVSTNRYSGAALGRVIEAQARTKKGVAKSLGVSESFLGKVIAGKRTLQPRLASQAAQLLGIAETELEEAPDAVS